MRLASHTLASLLVPCAFVPPCAAQCVDWSDAFAGPSVVQFDVYLASYAGQVHAFGLEPVSGTRRHMWFDGAAWRYNPLGGPTADVLGSAVFDDGSGPELYLTGDFTSPGAHIARWNGTAWSTIPGLPAHGAALVVYDDGSGPALVAGGNFTSPGAYVASYRNGTWSPLGSGTDGLVSALAVLDEGSGPRLFAAGEFNTAGGTPAAHVARWDGTTWTAVGGGIGSPVTTLATYDSGSGPRLYAGPAPGGVMVWNGTAWTSTGGGFQGAVSALAAYDDGAGPRLCAASGFGINRTAATYDGAVWTELPGGLRYATSCTAVNGRLALGAPSIGTIPSNSVLTFQGPQYRQLGAAAGFDARVFAFNVHDDGSGQKLYAGGQMWASDGVVLRGVARWSGERWEALGNGLMSAPGGNGPFDLEFYDAPGAVGPELYAGGGIMSVGTRVARFDGSAWSALPGSPVGAVNSLCVYDDGTGPELYAGGFFNFGGGSNVARFDGTTWTAAGLGTNSSVFDMEVFDEGAGPRLFAAGQFDQAGGVPALSIARFDGTNWSAVGAGLPSTVLDLALHDDGGGLALYAASFDKVYRWDGSVWTLLGAPLANQKITVLVSHDDGSGAELYAATGNVHANGAGGQLLFKRTGSAWLAQSDWFNANVRALASFGSPASPRLFVGGDFARAGNKPTGFVTTLSGDGAIVSACFGDGAAGVCPCGNTSAHAEHAGCANSTGVGGALLGAGCTHVASDGVVLTARGLDAGGAALFFQGAVSQPLGTGTPFNDGLLCVGGTITRLSIVTPSAGVASYPNPSQSVPVSVLGLVPASGGVRFYQVWYRNAAVFCTGATSNLTNAARIEWSM